MIHLLPDAPDVTVEQSSTLLDDLIEGAVMLESAAAFLSEKDAPATAACCVKAAAKLRERAK